MAERPLISDLHNRISNNGKTKDRRNEDIKDEGRSKQWPANKAYPSEPQGAEQLRGLKRSQMTAPAATPHFNPEQPVGGLLTDKKYDQQRF